MPDWAKIVLAFELLVVVAFLLTWLYCALTPEPPPPPREPDYIEGPDGKMIAIIPRNI